MRKGVFLQVKRWALAIMLVGCLGIYQAHADEQEEATFANYMAQWLKEPQLTFDQVRVETASLRSFYTAQNNRAFWLDARGLTPRAQAALAKLASASEEGLNAELYDVAAIQRIAALPAADDESRMRVRLSLELLMSHAILAYAEDMHAGSVRPQWKTGADPLTEAEQLAVLTQATAAADSRAYLASLAPQTPEYTALKASYKQYQALAANGGWPAFSVGKTIKPGMSDARVASLRQILTLTGDLPATTTPAEPGETYQGALVDAAKHFQERHGIEADGVLGSTTQQALAVPVGKRIEQMAMTLERMRWMPRDLGSRYVLVNVPGYRLRAVAGDQQLAMKVIVGKPDTKTPMFSKEITDVILNPSWGVPGKIAVKEMLPKIRKNPGYLAKAGYTVTENGQAVDPSTIDWSSVGHGNFSYSFRQQPGDGNALGKVKFSIPNSDNIYLHDTSQRGLFAKAERSLSHGCVRLGDPKALTEFVLKQEGWSAEKIETAYESSASRTIRVTPLPVHLVYWTSWVDEHGAPHFSRDIYGMDKTLLASMTKPTRDESIKLAMN